MRVIQEDVCGSLIHRTIIETSPEETKLSIKNQEDEPDPKSWLMKSIGKWNRVSVNCLIHLELKKEIK